LRSNETAPMKQWETVAIVGVGLIGGSIGIDLLSRGLAKHVVGIGRRPESLLAAKQAGAVTQTTTSLEEGVAQAELVVVCTPVGQIADDICRTFRACPDHALITDAGSTKAAIVAEVEKLAPRARFVGSHPLAGGEKSGPTAAVPNLFENRTVVITPTEKTDAADEARIVEFWTSLGAKIVRMSPEEHDRAVAAISHLPHLTASALAEATSTEDLPLAARGWLDSTRIAAGDPGLWKQILMVNRTHVLTAIARYEKVLGSLKAALENADEAQLEQMLTDAKRKRDALGS
jgi:prephenate dehydrogenase